MIIHDKETYKRIRTEVRDLLDKEDGEGLNADETRRLAELSDAMIHFVRANPDNMHENELRHT